LSIASAAQAADPSPAPADKPSDKRADATPPRAGNEVTLLRTVILSPAETQAATRPSPRETSFVAKAHQLDLVLSDALPDFGLTLDLSERAEESTEPPSEMDLVARAAKSGRWVVSPSIDVRGGDMVVRLAGVAPGSKVVFVRSDVVKPNELALRATV